MKKISIPNYTWSFKGLKGIGSEAGKCAYEAVCTCGWVSGLLRNPQKAFWAGYFHHEHLEEGDMTW